MQRIQDTFRRNRSLLIYVLSVTFVLGIWAHGYGFLQNSFSHDSLNEFAGNYGSNAWKIQLGRFVVPVYKAVFRTDLTLPWMIGCLSLLWIGLSVFLVVKLFRIDSRLLIALIAGIFTVNTTVTATAATYLHDVDGDLFALLCVVMAVYCWKNQKLGSLIGAVLIAIAMGIYQSYLAVAVVLIMLACMMELLSGADFWKVLLSGLKAIGMILLGGVLYFLVLQIVLKVTRIPLSSGDYNSLNTMAQLSIASLPSLIISAYIDCIQRLLYAVSPYPAVIGQGIVLFFGMIIFLSAVFVVADRQMGLPEKLLYLLLLCLLPLGMNFVYVLVSGAVHDLMVYALWLFYLVGLLLARWLCTKISRKPLRRFLMPVSMALAFFVLYGNIQVANAVYLKKDMESDAFLSFMTRVMTQVEACETYVPGVTPLVFVGTTDQITPTHPGFEDYSGITGQDFSAVTDTSAEYRMRTYFMYVLNNPANIPDSSHWDRMAGHSAVQTMPCYPADGCMAMIDGTLVVKLGQP